MLIKKISNFVYWVFVALLVALTIFVLVPLLPIPGNYKLLAVLSGSMEPEIKVGSLVVVVPTASYKHGDIVTFSSGKGGKSTVTHRIVDSKSESGKTVFVTKGDANNAPDTEPVARESVIGKVAFDIPWFGYLIAGSRKPLGFALIVLIPAAWIIFDETKKIVKEIRKPKPDARNG
jgi:signal peptidase